MGGLSNTVYKVVREEDNEIIVLVRVYGSHVTHDMRDTMQRISDVGVGPRIHHMTEHGSVEEWIDGRVMTRDEFHDPMWFSKIAREMARLHKGGFVHGDLHFNNIMVRPDNTIVFIDFEFAGDVNSPQDIAYDIANTFCEWTHRYKGNVWWEVCSDEYPTVSEQQQFLTAYGISPSDTCDWMSRIESHVRVVHSRWIRWAMERYDVTQDSSYIRFAEARATQHPSLLDEHGSVVYMDGAFDLIHVGHIDTLSRIRDTVLCSKLIIGIMSDVAVESYKRTPVLCAEERGMMIASIRGVDKVIVDAPFMEEMTDEFLDLHEIDLVMYGGDPNDPDPIGTWEPHYRPVIARGILRMIGYSDKQSTSSILNRIREN
jgi:cytidyltransferase-like protein